MGVALWLGFREEMSLLLLLSVSLVVGSTIVLCFAEIYRAKHRSGDRSARGLTHLHLLCTSVPPSVLVAVIFVLRYSAVFPMARVSPLGQAINAASVSLIVAYALSYALVLGLRRRFSPELRGSLEITLRENRGEEVRQRDNKLNPKRADLALPPFTPLWRTRYYEPDPNFCFILMPFSNSSPYQQTQDVYQVHVKPTLGRLGLKCVRADDIFGPTPIMEDIWHHILKSRLVLAEVTGRNPNVFYELGIAHTVGRQAIVITQNEGDIPFDIKAFRYVKYDLSPIGLRDFEHQLERSVSAVLNMPPGSTIPRSAQPRASSGRLAPLA